MRSRFFVKDQDDLWKAAGPRERIDVVVLLTSRLARGDGMSICSTHQATAPDPPAVLIYSAYAGDWMAVSAAVAQADALVDKAQPVEALLDAIRRLARGERLILEPEAELLAAASSRLHADDVPLLALLVYGARSNEIADALQMGEDEVRRRARRVIGRLQRRTSSDREGRLRAA